MKNIFNRKSVFVKSLSVWSAFAVIITTSAPAFAAGTAVLGGSADLQNLTRATMGKNDPNAAVFSSDAASAVLDWNRFNIGSGQSMSFNGAGTTFFNLVDGAAGRSQIDGIINGSGNVWVINPAGIAFGASSSVNVGGLFAAAAGNLENAAALRDGTATMPSFSSFGGSVDASRGMFAANQVALMGKTVSVAEKADFTDTLALTVGAGKFLTVDDVGGGLVTVDAAAAAEFADAAVDIDGLLAGNALVEVVADGNVRLDGPVGAGELSVSATHSVAVDGDVVTTIGGVEAVSAGKGDVVVNGFVDAAGEVGLVANDGRVAVASGAKVMATDSDVVLMAGVLPGTSGEIEVDGTVMSNGGDVMMMAGKTGVGGGSGGVACTYCTPGSIKVEADGMVAASGDVSAMSTDGTTVDGLLYSAYGSVSAIAGMGDSGDVMVGGEIEAYSGVTLAAGMGYSPIDGSPVYNQGSVRIGEGAAIANVASGDISLMAINGVVDVGAGATVDNAAPEGSVQVLTVGSLPNTGGVCGPGEQAAVTVAGSISADQIAISTQRGDVSVDGELRSAAEDGKIVIKAATDKTAEGNVFIDGTIAAKGSGGSVEVYAGYGRLKADGKIEGEDGPAMMMAASPKNLLGASDAETSGSVISMNDRANVMAKERIVLESDAGVRNAGTINALDALLEVYGHDGDVDLYADDSGVVIVTKVVAIADGDVFVDNPRNIILDLDGSKGDSKNGAVFDSDADALPLNNDVFAFYKQLYGVLWTDGNIVICGDIESPGFIGIITDSGDITVLPDCTVRATGNDSEILISAGVELDGYGFPVRTAQGDLSRIGAGQVAVAGSLDADVVTVLSSDGITVPTDVGSSIRGDYGVTAETLGDARLGGSIAAEAGVVFVRAKGDVSVSDIAAGSVEFLSQTERFSINLVSQDGKVSVSDGANLFATSPYGLIGIYSFAGDPSRGGVDVRGSVTAEAGGAGGVGSVDIMALNGDVNVDGTIRSDSMTLVTANNGNVSIDGSVGGREVADVRAEVGNVNVAGDVTAVLGEAVATSGRGDVTITGRVQGKTTANVRTESGAVSVAGSVIAEDGTAYATAGRGSVKVEGTVDGGATAFVENLGGDVVVNGTVAADDMTYVVSRQGDVVLNGDAVSRGRGEVRGVLVEATDGDIVVNGSVRGEGADGIALVSAANRGNVVIGAQGKVLGKGGVTVKTDDGDLLQQGAANVDARHGYATPQSLPSALSGDYVVMKVNGDVGGENGGSLAVDGKVIGQVSGDVRLAAANGGSLQGGSKQDAAQFIQTAGSYIGLDLSQLGDNTAVDAGGDLSIYTAGKAEAFTSFYAGGNLTLSAASFGDLSYMRAGGTLTINNVGHPAYPQVAYFESVNGREPKINNQPNDTVIFVDGRLAGGNLNILNKFGADEAFMVETPELKSTQGIFGNPPFLHSDLDVANPMEVSAIDYLIQEIPRLTLSSDFPADVDQTIEASGLGQKDSYWFGQKGTDEKKTGDVPAENTAGPEKESEKQVDKKVAMAH